MTVRRHDQPDLQGGAAESRAQVEEVIGHARLSDMRSDKPGGISETGLQREPVSDVRWQGKEVGGLSTPDGRLFERQQDGSYLISTNGNDHQIRAQQVTYQSGWLNYQIGPYLASEGPNGQRFVCDVRTGDRVELGKGNTNNGGAAGGDRQVVKIPDQGLGLVAGSDGSVRGHIGAATAAAMQGDNLRSQAILARVMATHPEAVKDRKFLTAMVLSGADCDQGMLSAFSHSGGDTKTLQRLSQQLNQPLQPREYNFNQMWQAFNLPLSEKPIASPVDRMAEYAKLKDRHDPESNARRLLLLADHYLVDSNDAQRKQAMELFQKESQAGNKGADAYLTRLPLYAVAEQGINGVNFRRAQFRDAQTRLDYIEREQEKLPSERNPMKVPEAIVEHYIMARTEREREQALDLLRKEVRMGNLSAGFTLFNLTKADAALRAVEAMDRMGSGDPNAAFKLQRAMQSLAQVQDGDLQRQYATNVVDILKPAPHTGEEAAAKREHKQSAAPVAENVPPIYRLFNDAVASNGTDREKTVADLQKLIDSSKGTTRGREAQGALDLATTVFAAQDILYGLGDTDRSVKGLLAAGKLAAQGNPEAQELLERIDKSGDNGAKLVTALAKPDGLEAAALMKDPELIRAVGKEAKRFVDAVRPSDHIDISQSIDALAKNPALGLTPADTMTLRQLAMEFNNETQQDAKDAIGKYLQRDTIGKETREHLAAALPAAGEFILTDKQLKKELEQAITDKLLSPTLAKYATRLVSGDRLQEDEVRDLARELRQTNDGRRSSALGSLAYTFDERVGVYGSDLRPGLTTLEAIDAAYNANRGAKDALKVLNNDQSDESQRYLATEQALAKVIELQRLYHNDFNHPLANQICEKFPGGGKAFDQLTDDLKISLDNHDYNKAKELLEKVQKDLPDGDEQANQFRTLRIVQNLGPESSPTDFRRAHEQLDREVQASRIESSTENKAAADWSKWAQTSEQVAIISQASGENNPEQAAKAVKDLIAQARDGNPYARTALAACLVGNTEHSYEFLKAFPQVNGKPIYVPNFDGLDPAVKEQLAKQALQGYMSVYGDRSRNHEPDLINGPEAMAVAMTLSKQYEGGKEGDKRTIQQCNAILQIANGDTDPERRSQVMTGLLAAMELNKDSTKDIADHYVHYLGDAKFADHFAYVQELARQGNQGAMRVLAKVTAGEADTNTELKKQYPAAASSARNMMEKVADSSPEMRGKVTDALMHADVLGRFTDQNQLMATLGSVAAKLDDRTENGIAKRDAAMERLRISFEKQQWAQDYEKGGYKSTYDGMLSMAKYWTTRESDTFTNKLKPDIVAGLDQVSAQLKPEVAQSILKRAETDTKSLLKEGIYHSRQDKDELVSLLRTTAALAQYASVDQVQLVKSLGGTPDWGKNPGSELLRKQFNFNDTEIRDVQAEAGRALLMVLGKAPNGTDGPREQAYDAFQKIPWPIKTDKGQWIENSHESQKLRDTLINYAEGKPFDVKLFREVSRIVDEAHLPIPPASLLAEANMGSTKKEDIGSGLTVWEKAGKIIDHYTKDGEKGADVLRRVLSNLELVNHMSGLDRAQVMSWDTLPPEQMKKMGWFQDAGSGEFQRLGLQALPPQEQKRIMEAGLDSLTPKYWADLEQSGRERWKDMSAQERETFRWQNAPKLDKTSVLGAMVSGKLEGNVLAKSLLDGHLSEKAESRSVEHAKISGAEKREGGSYTSNRQREFDALIATTKKGASTGGQVLGVLTLDNGRDAVLVMDQQERLKNMSFFEQKLATANRRAQAEDTQISQLDLAIQTAKYRALLNQGEQVAADKIAMDMWRKHGPVLSALAGDVWSDLTVSQENSIMGASSLKRLHLRGMAQFDKVPGYDTGFTGFRQALGLEHANATNNEGSDPKLPQERGLRQLAKEENKYLDTEALRAHMFQRVDQDELMLKFTNASREMTRPMAELGQMIDAARHGDAYEDYIQATKDRAEIIQRNLNAFSQEDLNKLKERITAMQDALKGPPPMDNQAASTELRDKITAYQKLHNLFNQTGTLDYPDVAERGENREIRDLNKEWRELCKNAQTMTPATLSAYLKENAPMLIAMGVATVATIAAAATFGLATPVAALAFAGLAYTMREGAKEVMFHINKDGYTGWGQANQHGAELFQWAFRQTDHSAASFWHDVGKDALKEMGKDAASWCVGGYLGRLVGPAESSAASAAGRGYFRTFIGHLPKETWNATKFMFAGQLVDYPIHRAIGKDNLHDMGEWGQFALGFTTSNLMGMYAGYRSARIQAARALNEGALHQIELAPGATKEGVIEQKLQEGFIVKPVKDKPNLFEILPANAKPGMKPITLEFVAPGTIPVEGVAASKPGAQPERQAASNVDPTADPRISNAKPNPEKVGVVNGEIKAANEKLQATTEAVRAQNREGNRLSDEMNRKVSELPEGPKRAEEEARLRKDYEEKIGKADQEAQRLEEEAAKQRESLKSLKMAQQIAEGNFPPGEYLLRLDGHSPIKLSVAVETVAKDGTVVSRQVGEPVPSEHVLELIKTIEGAKIKPESVVIKNVVEGTTDGTVNSHGNTYEVTINVGTSNQPIRLIYNHETGHIYDFAHFRPGAEAQASKAIADAYHKALTREGGPLDQMARDLHMEPSKAFREQMARDLENPRPRQEGQPPENPTDKKYKYYLSKEELFAEMYKLHQEKQRIMKEGGAEPTYEQLLKEYTAKYNRTRAGSMQGMEDLFKTLEKEAFESFRVRQKLPQSARMQQMESIADKLPAANSTDQAAYKKQLIDVIVDVAKASEKARPQQEAGGDPAKAAAQKQGLEKKLIKALENCTPEQLLDHARDIIKLSEHPEFSKFAPPQEVLLNPEVSPSLHKFAELIDSPTGMKLIADGHGDFLGTALQAMSDGPAAQKVIAHLTELKATNRLQEFAEQVKDFITPDAEAPSGSNLLKQRQGAAAKAIAGDLPIPLQRLKEITEHTVLGGLTHGFTQKRSQLKEAIDNFPSPSSFKGCTREQLIEILKNVDSEIAAPYETEKYTKRLQELGQGLEKLSKSGASAPGGPELIAKLTTKNAKVVETGPKIEAEYARAQERIFKQLETLPNEPHLEWVRQALENAKSADRTAAKKEWRAGGQIVEALNSNPALKDWVYAPAEYGSRCDGSSMDGFLVNKVDGRIRPVDFKKMALPEGTTHENINPDDGPFGLRLGDKGAAFGKDPGGNVENFLKRDAAAAELPADFVARMRANGGEFPPNMRKAPSTDLAGEIDAGAKYLKRLHAEYDNCKAAGNVPKWLETLVGSAEGNLHHNRCRSELINDVPATIGKAKCDIQTGTDKNGEFTDVRFDPEIKISPPKTDRKVTSDPKDGELPFLGFRTYPDGKVMAVCKGKHREVPVDMGSWKDLREALTASVKKMPESPAKRDAETELNRVFGAVDNFVVH